MTTKIAVRMQLGARCNGALRLLLACIFFCCAAANVRADRFGYRFSPLGNPDMPSVALSSDLDELPQRGLLSKDGVVYTLDGQRLGFFDSEHTGPTGRQWSSAGIPYEVGNRPGHVPMDFHHRNVRGLIFGVSQRATEFRHSAWLYDPASKNTTQLGFISAEFNSTDPISSSDVRAINDAGHVLGTSSYAGSSAAWLYQSETKEYKDLGLLRERVTAGNAPGVYIRPMTLDAAGNVAGNTIHSYDGQGIIKRLLWYHAADETDARPIGRPSDAYEYGMVEGRTRQGHIFGETGAISLNDMMLFVYDPVEDVSTYLRAPAVDGVWPESWSRGYWADRTPFQPVNPGPMPFALGYFELNRNTPTTERRAWLFDPESKAPTRLGPTSEEHGVTDGREFTEFVAWNEHRVFGTSRSYGSDGYQGQTVWMYDVNVGTTRDIGLDGAEFRRADGIATNRVIEVRKDGRIIGTAELTRGENASFGTASWLFDPATGATTQQGLYGSDVLQAEGTIATTIADVTSTGFVLGTSDFTHGENGTFGTAAWVFDPTTRQTKRVGFYGDEFRRADGYQRTTVLGIGPSGHALGHSYYRSPRPGYCVIGGPGEINYCDAAIVARLWLYDPESSETIAIATSDPQAPEADLRLWSVDFVDADGAILGSCITGPYPTNPYTTVETRACMWTRDEGLVDLNELVGPDFSEWGPIVLESIDAVNSAGLLVGTMRAENKTFPYMLTPVPEPGTWGLVSSTVLCTMTLIPVRRRARFRARTDDSGVN